MTTQITQVRCVAVTKDTVVFDGHRFDSEPRGDLFTGGLDNFLGRMAKAFRPGRGGGGTVLIDQDAATALGFPQGIPAGDAATDHPVIVLARSAGWKISALQPWMTFWAPGRPTIHIGVLGWLDGPEDPGVTTFALLDRHSIARTTHRCALFHEWTQTAFHGTNSGLAGIAKLKDNWRAGRYEPLWKPKNWDQIKPANAATEVANRWRTTREHGQPWELGYDCNVAHLAAAGVAMFAINQLANAPVPAGQEDLIAQEQNPAGYYLVPVPDWEWSEYIPHPLGSRAQMGESVWITAPTLDLWWEIANNHPGAHLAPPVVYDRWISRRQERVMRPWAEGVRDALDAAIEHEDQALTGAVKSIYKDLTGMLMRPTSRIYRPDWAHTIIATTRCNLWRKVWNEGAEQWPSAWDADTVWYPAPEDDLDRYWPRHFPEKSGPGGFHPYGTRRTA